MHFVFLLFSFSFFFFFSYIIYILYYIIYIIFYFLFSRFSFAFISTLLHDDFLGVYTTNNNTIYNVTIKYKKDTLFCAKIFFEFFVYWAILQQVTKAKGSILFIRMIMKRTFHNHNGLVFNGLRDFIGGGGVKTAKVSCGANLLFLKKKNF